MAISIKGDRVLLALLAFTLAVDLCALGWGLPNTTEYDPDSSVPMTAMRGAICGFSGGWVGQHQPLQPMLISLLCAPYMAVLFLGGYIDMSAVTRAYPWGLQDPVTSLSGVILVGRGLSVLAHLVLVWAMYRAAHEASFVRAHEDASCAGTVGLVAAAATATCYPFVYYAHVGNPDMTYLACMGVALWAYLRLAHEAPFVRQPGPLSEPPSNLCERGFQPRWREGLPAPASESRAWKARGPSGLEAPLTSGKRIQKSLRPLDHVAVLASAAALSTSVKFQALPFFAGMVPVVLWVLFWQRGASSEAPMGRSSLRPPALILLAGVLVFGATFAAANNLLFNPTGLPTWLHYKVQGVEWARTHEASFVRRGVAGREAGRGPGFAAVSADHFLDGLGLPVILLALVGLVTGRRSRQVAALGLPLIAALLFYWRTHVDFMRYLFPAFLPVLCLAGLGADWLWRQSFSRGPGHADRPGRPTRRRVGRASRPTASAGRLAEFRRPVLAALGVLSALYLGARAVGCDWLMLQGSHVQVERWLLVHGARFVHTHEAGFVRQHAGPGGATVEVYQPANYVPRLRAPLRVVSFDRDVYFADVRRRASFTGGAGVRELQVPPELLTAQAIRRRAPDFLVLVPGSEPDASLAAALDAPGSGYVRAATFGGPTALVRETLSMNREYWVYQAEGRRVGRASRPTHLADRDGRPTRGKP